MKAGEKYKCIKTVIMQSENTKGEKVPGNTEFIKGKIYTANNDRSFTNESGNENHVVADYDIADWFNEHFVKVNDVAPKIAIRVENKREFEAVVCKMAENGWGDAPSLKMRYAKVWPLITYHDGFYCSVDEHPLVLPDYTIITFQEFALISGVKVAPSEVVLKLDNEVYKVTPHEVYVDLDGRQILYIADSILEKIYEAYKSLQ